MDEALQELLDALRELRKDMQDNLNSLENIVELAQKHESIDTVEL